MTLQFIFFSGTLLTWEFGSFFWAETLLTWEFGSFFELRHGWLECLVHFLSWNTVNWSLWSISNFVFDVFIIFVMRFILTIYILNSSNYIINNSSERELLTFSETKTEIHYWHLKAVSWPNQILVLLPFLVFVAFISPWQNYFSPSNLHDRTNPTVQIPKIWQKLLEWVVTLRLYVWQCVLVWGKGWTFYLLTSTGWISRVFTRECWPTKAVPLLEAGDAKAEELRCELREPTLDMGLLWNPLALKVQRNYKNTFFS